MNEALGELGERFTAASSPTISDSNRRETIRAMQALG